LRLVGFKVQRSRFKVFREWTLKNGGRLLVSIEIVRPVE
jgi:hypothetical protein